MSIGIVFRRVDFRDHFQKIEQKKKSLYVPGGESSSKDLVKVQIIPDETEQKEKIYQENIFPISFDKEMEEIRHPSIVYGAKIPEGLPETLMLPKFWNPRTHGGDIRRFLGDGALLTPEKAASVGSLIDGKETILVVIASYRDPECQNTVEDLYLRAEHPHRIRTVVVDQLREGDKRCTEPKQPCDEDPEQVVCYFSHLIHSYELDARLAVGPTLARHIAHRHYRNEYFVLQLDAHVRFVKNWDSDISEQWKSAQNEMAVLTTYMLDLNGSIDPKTHESRKVGRALLCNVDFENGILRNGQQAARPPGIHGTPTLHPFWAAGFSFSRGHFVVQVPYDLYLPQIFQGEEMSIALRGFSYGYDYYAPERNVCFHMYALNKFRENRLSVPKFTENKATFKGVEEKAMKRLIVMLGMNTGGNTEETYQNIDERLYGLGRARTLETFFSTFGIHVENQTIENHLCWFVGEQMHRAILPRALRNDGMGIDYHQVDFKFVDPAPDQP